MKTLTGPLLLFLWLQLDWMSKGEEIQQHPSFLTIWEGASFVINCTYTDSTSDYFFWYKQEPGKGLQLLISTLSNVVKKQEKRLTVLFNKKDKHLSLQDTATHPGDSATYFCATSSYGQLTFGAGTRLAVHPYVKEPDPAVYQLGGSKSNQISVCLFTDFDSETNVQEPQGPAVISLNSTVLDMKVMNSKSNAALAWGNSTDFKCNGTFNEKFFSSSDFSCDATLIAKNFETDMNLNFHNLIVIGLRILLLKVAGFNLFMTLRLWSR